jgi:hypothetical protein
VLLEVSVRFGKRLKPPTFPDTMVPSDNFTNQKLLKACSLHLMAAQPFTNFQPHPKGNSAAQKKKRGFKTIARLADNKIDHLHLHSPR